MKGSFLGGLKGKIQGDTASYGRWTEPKPRGDLAQLVSDLSDGPRILGVVVVEDDAWAAVDPRAIDARLKVKPEALSEEAHSVDPRAAVFCPGLEGLPGPREPVPGRQSVDQDPRCALTEGPGEAEQRASCRAVECTHVVR